MRYRFLGILFIILMIQMPIIHANPLKGYDDPVAVYQGDTGITIVSYSNNWSTQSKLQTVYNELLKNTHGEELAYLSTVYIYPDAPTGVGSHYYDSYSQGKDGKWIYSKNRYINIYNGDQYTELSQIARLLAHEYGHHFTFYYLVTKEGLPKTAWLSSKYYQVRDLKDYPLITYIGDSKKYSHEWDIAEILAEDYVQLYGSALAKQSRDYQDVQERTTLNAQGNYFYTDFNLLPQENLDLPMAVQVPGLVDYFYNLTNVRTTKVPENLQIPVPYLYDIENVYEAYNAYYFKWNPFTDGKKREFTLVINEKGSNDYPIPIKTITSYEDASAVAGSYVDLAKKIGVLKNYEGDFELRLFVKDANGFMHSSSVVALTIRPMDNAKSLFTDVPKEYWANDAIYQMANRGIVTGYTDGSFKPINPVTRAEFMAFLLRSLPWVNLQKTSSTHWFVAEGYETAAVQTGMLLSKDRSGAYYDTAATRQEMARMVYNILDDLGKDTLTSRGVPYNDVSGSSYEKEIGIVSYYGVMNGYLDGKFKPTRQATRAEAMAIISRIVKMQE